MSRKYAAQATIADCLLLDELEIARICSVSRPMVRKWVRDGYLPRVDLPHGTRRALYRRSDVETFCAGLPSHTPQLIVVP